MKIMYSQILIVLLLLFGGGCKKSESSTPNKSSVPTSVFISTDRARYNPNDTIVFSIDKSLPATVKVRYKHFDEKVDETYLTGTTWNWKAPSTDFTGYMVDIYDTINGDEKIYGCIAVDVSSDWSHFPRYGFLSKYPQMTNTEINSVINDLNRHHINGLQFYDWQYKHHQPLAGTVANPDEVWKDIANRDTYLSTIKQYITEAHNHNMNAMFYNLAYGALNDASYDGVSDQWYIYTDQAHSIKDEFDLPNPPFKSNIYLLDPSNVNWQQYITEKNNDVYAVFDFDGYHIDQLGDRNKNLYTYSGTSVNLASTFKPFIEAMKVGAPEKRLVMNAVNQYGQQGGIAEASTDFLYTEVWSPNEGYKDLATIINNNDTYSSSTKKTVLAAYMDYNLASSSGYFNTPGVLFTDAVIFAFGGSHIELGEHMLGQEYFPNDNLQMKADLTNSIVQYYDFLVAYENLLKDGGTFNTPAISSADNQIVLNNWPPQSNSISIVGKNFDARQVIHLLNFANASTFDWRDANGTQTVPGTFQNCKFVFSASSTVKKIWYASPDVNFGTSTDIKFTQTGNSVSFTIPFLKYWDMIVIEY